MGAGIFIEDIPPGGTCSGYQNHCVGNVEGNASEASKGE